jgi:OmpR-family two-component system manganese-sensing sensor histidine kinase
MLQGGGFALLLLAAFSGSLYWDIAVQRGEDQRTELRQLAASAAAQWPLIEHETREVAGSKKFQGQRNALALEGLEQQRVQWFDAEGQLLSEQGSLEMPPRADNPATPETDAQWQRWRGGISLWQPVLSDGRKPIGAVRVALSDQAASADLERLRRGLLLGAVVTAMAALLVGRRMLRSAFSPLQQQLMALQQFTADASHELRHPLTSLRTLLAAVPADLQQHPALAWRDLDTLSRRMGELLDDLLFLARQQQSGTDGRTEPELSESFDLLELLEDLMRCSASQAVSAAVALQLSPDPTRCSVPIQANSQQLLRLFTNLLDNAIRHSPEGGTVRVEVTPCGGQVQVAVIDQGPGIPTQQQEQVFLRFWRGGDRGGHSGLGLAIARAIARRHGGELRVSESRQGRCVLLVELPTNIPTP